MSEGLPNKDSELVELRLLRSQIEGKERLITVQIAEHDKRMSLLTESIETNKKHVEKWAAPFSLLGILGLSVGIWVLLFLLYRSLEPVVQNEVTNKVSREVQRIDWDRKLEKAAQSELKKIVTAEALAQVVDQESIKAAVSAVVSSDEFNSQLQPKLDKAVGVFVTRTVDNLLAEQQRFEDIVKRELQAQQERIKQLNDSSTTPIRANDRQQLVTKLTSAISVFREIGREFFYIDVHPVGGSLHIHARVRWEPDQPANNRLQLLELSVAGLSTADQKYRKLAASYFEQEVPDSIRFVPIAEGSAKSFRSGRSRRSFATYDELVSAIVSDAVILSEECFEMIYPAEWRVKLQ